MKILKSISGLLALILTFVGISLLVGQFIPAMEVNSLSPLERLGYGFTGLLSLICAVKIWIWSTN